ncbi:MAG: hypothetical protein US20_C0026G0026 [Candidatus Pacebacteria bacterium GW2011_GWF1_36_5]|nr:MAG: hypothetical protein US20_C0026G0026 [Candidatus Pacebacteria bacterium GW2011_GWF1_36_5]
MTFRVTLPDDPDLPLKDEDKHQTDTKELQKSIADAFDNRSEPGYAPVNSPSLEEIFRDAIPQLISIVEEVNPPEKTKVIGKLRGALELFNQK